MSLDRSLKAGGGLSKHRNVLTRTERIAKLASIGKFDKAAGEPLGLIKVGNRKLKAVKTEKKTDGAAAADPKAAKGAAPAAKAAAPAAKGAKK